MSREYRIRDVNGERVVDENSLPLTLGGAAAADVALPGLAADAVVGLIALNKGHAYVQPRPGTSSLFLNHERLSESAWLKSGDLLQINDAGLNWTVQGDRVFLQLAEETDATRELNTTELPLLRSASPNGLPVNVSRAPPPRGGRGLRLFLLAFFLLLLAVAGFVMLAIPITLQLKPAPSSHRLQGEVPPIPVWGRYLVLPGRYALHAERDGYRPLRTELEVSAAGPRVFSFALQPLPGLLELQVLPAVPYAARLDGEAWDYAGGFVPVEAGRHTLSLSADGFVAVERELQIQGRGQRQSERVRLEPAGVRVRLDTLPSGAQVSIDGEPAGITPLDTRLPAGAHRFEFALDGYAPAQLEQALQVGTELTRNDIELAPQATSLTLDSDPPGAEVRVDGEVRGATPLDVELTPGTEHTVQWRKPGYAAQTRQVGADTDLAAPLTVKLEPEYGTVFISSRPADAKLWIDGKAKGKATRRLRLTTRSHELEIRKAGYQSQTLTVTPAKDESRNLEVVLERTRSDAGPAPVAVAKPRSAGRAQLGSMIEIEPGVPFVMGASRREAGRRSNESRRLVQLTRPFYLAAKEVSNAEFRRFHPLHDSGSALGAGLNGDDQPVVNVSWDDAARYCNWLSEREGLPAFYRDAGGRMETVEPANTGYRLPSEAEWTYAARYRGRKEPARYAWDGDYPPAGKVANLADKQVAGQLGDVVPAYDDDYRVSAPVGSFPLESSGFYDLGGNVAEWMHDRYAVYPGMAERLVRDPMGPAYGEHRVIRGASWRDGSLSELRLSYRDYGNTPRDDLGFRVARYRE